MFKEKNNDEDEENVDKNKKSAVEKNRPKAKKKPVDLDACLILGQESAHVSLTGPCSDQA